jgi:hypothetical protein
VRKASSGAKDQDASREEEEGEEADGPLLLPVKSLDTGVINVRQRDDVIGTRYEY